MTQTVFSHVTYPISLLIQQIDLGIIGLPEIQRPFVWPNSKVRELFDSMYRGFPVGYLLFWTNGLADGHKQIGVGTKQTVPSLLVVDGQQRLTSLYTVIKGAPVVREDFREERIVIAFRPKDGAFEVTDAAIRKDPEFIPDISPLLSGQIPQFQFIKQFLANLKAHRPVDDDEESRLSSAIIRLHDLLGYPFTALQLSEAVDEEEVAEVFVRINSKGTPLNQADFILTLMSVFWDEGRKELESFCRSAKTPAASGASPFNHFIRPSPDQMLLVSVALGFRRARLRHVYSILRGKDLESGRLSEERRVAQFQILKSAQEYALNLQNWKDFLQVLTVAGYRSGDMITSQVGLMYCYALFLIGRRDYQVDHSTLRNVMARWYFMTALTSRYTNSPESVMEQDLARLREVKDASAFVALLDRIIGSVFTQDYWSITLPFQMATSAVRTPPLFAYYAALNILGAKALFSKMHVADLLDPAAQATKSAVERHHLFPKGYLAKLGIAEVREVNQIANFALVEWRDNVGISDTPPSEYFPKLTADLDPQELARMRYWHALPEGWETMDYPTFLEARRKAMASVIRDGFERLVG